MRTNSTIRRGLAVLTAVMLTASACGDDGGSEDSSSPGDGTAAAATTTAAPVSGGTLTVGVYQETFGLDPLVSTGGGITGSTEMAAIYDTITRWNPQTNEYEPKTAESLTPNADRSEWTVKIRSGIKFTDGTDYDAEAVKWGVDRHLSGLIPGVAACEELRACPRNGVQTAGYMGANLKSSQVVDKLTVKFTMQQAFPAFPATLAAAAGMIPSPTAMKAACPADKAATPANCSFNLKPVGAGPFMIDNFVKGESITMKKNPGYWNGPVYLDGLKFVDLRDAGGDKVVDGLKSGSIQLGYLRQWPAVRNAEAAKWAFHSNLLSGGLTLLMNNGISVTCANGAPTICQGRPDGPYVPKVATSNPKVRQAIAAAVDTQQLDARVNDGKGAPGSALIHPTNRLYPGVEGPKYDLNRAKQLVADAKAEGWDAKVRFVCSTTPYGEKFAVTFQTMMQAIGVTVETKLVQNPSTEVIVNRDYDTACWGLAPYSDDLGFWQLFGNLSSTAVSNRMGYKSTAMDAGLAAVRAASTDDQKKAGYKLMAEAYVADSPLLVVGALDERFTWTDKVQGVRPSVQTIALFDKAWLKP